MHFFSNFRRIVWNFLFIGNMKLYSLTLIHKLIQLIRGKEFINEKRPWNEQKEEGVGKSMFIREYILTDHTMDTDIFALTKSFYGVITI